MDVLKNTIKEVEEKVTKIHRLGKVLGNTDFVVKSNNGYNAHVLTTDQKDRMYNLLEEFKQEMEDKVTPVLQRLSTLEQLLG